MLVASLILGCAPRVPPWNASAPAEWLPAGTTQALRSSPDTFPLITALAALGDSCVLSVARTFDVAWQLHRGATGGGVVVVFGDGSRDEVEACARRVWERADPDAARLGIVVKRDGVFSTFEAPGGQQQVAAFPSGRVVWADTRDAVEHVLSDPRLAPDDPLVPLLSRLGNDGQHSVTSLDYSGPFTGVPSVGATTNVAKDAQGVVTGGATVLFAQTEDASAFVTAVERLRTAPEGDPRMRTLVGLLDPHQDGASVSVDLPAVIVAGTSTHPEIFDWVNEQGARVLDAPSPSVGPLR